MLFKAMCLYALLVFAGGTLVNTGNPVASEVGRLIQVVTLVEPTIGWAESHGVDPLAHSLRFLADGFPVSRVTG
jgi:hypothetical protein